MVGERLREDLVRRARPLVLSDLHHHIRNNELPLLAEFLLGMLFPDADHRWSANFCLAHPFLSNNGSNASSAVSAVAAALSACMRRLASARESLEHTCNDDEERVEIGGSLPAERALHLLNVFAAQEPNSCPPPLHISLSNARAAIDAGGVRDATFSELFTTAASPSSGDMYLLCAEEGSVALMPRAVALPDYLRALGRAIACCMLDGRPIGVPLAVPLLRFLLFKENELTEFYRSLPVTKLLNELALISPELSTQYLMALDMENIADIVPDEIVDERGLPVELRSDVNKQTYLRHLALHKLINGPRVALRALRDGMFEVGPIRTVLTNGQLEVSDLAVLMCGTTQLTPDEVLREIDMDHNLSDEFKVCYDGPRRDHHPLIVPCCLSSASRSGFGAGSALSPMTVSVDLSLRSLDCCPSLLAVSPRTIRCDAMLDNLFLSASHPTAPFFSFFLLFSFSSSAL
jgi:hypothetical protein